MNMESRLKLGIIIPNNKILGGKIYTPVSDPSLNPREKCLLVSRSTIFGFSVLKHNYRAFLEPTLDKKIIFFGFFYS